MPRRFALLLCVSILVSAAFGYSFGFRHGSESAVEIYVPIDTSGYVFVASKSGKRYHTRSYCDGLSSAVSVERIRRSEAEERGLTACFYCTHTNGKFEQD